MYEMRERRVSWMYSESTEHLWTDRWRLEIEKELSLAILLNYSPNVFVAFCKDFPSEQDAEGEAPVRAAGAPRNVLVVDVV